MLIDELADLLAYPFDVYLVFWEDIRGAFADIAQDFCLFEMVLCFWPGENRIHALQKFLELFLKSARSLASLKRLRQASMTARSTFKLILVDIDTMIAKNSFDAQGTGFQHEDSISHIVERSTGLFSAINDKCFF